MELALAIIYIAIFIFTLCFIASLIWEWKSKESMHSIIARMVFATVLFVIEIPRLILEVSLGKEYASAIYLLVLWALHVVFSVIIIRNKRAREKLTVSVGIKISEYSSPDEDDAECENEQKD